jgi:hypothetical protein
VLGSTSLLFALVSAASREGAWIALVGEPAAGTLAAAEHGIDLRRLALVPDPGHDWPTVVAALLDGLDLVAVHPTEPVDEATARRLAARTRQRGAVLLPTCPWPTAEVNLRATDARWHGLEAGRGRLRYRQLTAVADGRGRLARPRKARVWLPGPEGAAIAPVFPEIATLPRAA